MGTQVAFLQRWTVTKTNVLKTRNVPNPRGNYRSDSAMRGRQGSCIYTIHADQTMGSTYIRM